MLTVPAPPLPPAKPSSPGTIPSKQESSTRVPMTSLSSSGLSNGEDVKTEPEAEAKRSIAAPASGSGSGSIEIATAGTSETMDPPKATTVPTPTLTPTPLAKTGPSAPAPPIPAEAAVDSYKQVIEIEDDPVSGPLDPLSHLSTIFDKIRRQVIEWGEDANWKIDVFLLPSDEPGSANGETSTPPLPSTAPVHKTAHPHGRPNAPPTHPYTSSHPQPPHPGPYSSLPGASSRHIPPPPHYGQPSHHTLPYNGPHPPPHHRAPPSQRDQLSGTRHTSAAERPGADHPSFVLQPPPSDLPGGEDSPASLQDEKINTMSEAEAKKMLSIAVRQIRDQQTTITEAAHSFEAVQRHSAQRERDLTARLEAEKAVMERDAAVLARKWKESSASLLEIDNEVRDIFIQMEAEKAQITKRNSDRRKRVDEQVYPLKGASDQAAFSRSDCSRPNHDHRHRRVHYHRHHHRHMALTRRGDTFASGADSLDNLATLAAQVLTGEPLVLAKKAHIPVKRRLPLPLPEDIIVIEDTPEAADETDMIVEDDKPSSSVKDEGLALRPVIIERQASPIVDAESEDEPKVKSSQGRGDDAGGDLRETRSATTFGPSRSMSRSMAGQSSATTRGSAYGSNLRSSSTLGNSSSSSINTRGGGPSRTNQEMKHGASSSASSSSFGRDRLASKHRRI